MVWFVTIVLSVYGLVNFYLFWRMKYFLMSNPLIYKVFLFVFLAWALCYPLGRILEIWFHNDFQRFLIHLGSFWLAYFVYLLLGTLLFDVVSMILKISPAKVVAHSSFNLKFYLFMNVIILFAILIGNINANKIRVVHQKIHVKKQALKAQSIRIALITDIHLGTIIHNSYLRKIVSLTNAENPDIILLGGDVIDEDVNSVIEQNMGDELIKFEAPLGIYAITGNHEYISGAVDVTEKYLKESGTTLLRDTTLIVNNTILLTGREDRSSVRFSGYRRKPLKDLIKDYNLNQYLSILLDHQPFNLEEAEQAGFDLQLSGHTHHGQLFPFNFITNKVYEKSWGYLRKGNTHYYISCGVGTWGPRVRIGNHPEIVIIDVLINIPNENKRNN